jgi:quinol monooxygenase YgiN
MQIESEKHAKKAEDFLKLTEEDEEVSRTKEGCC